MTIGRWMAGVAAAAILAAAGEGEAQAPVQAPAPALTTPEQALGGHKPGDDYFLANYDQLSAYWKTLASQSPRAKLVVLGKTAEGRDQLMMVVSSPQNVARLDHWREITRRLGDGRIPEAEAHALAAEGKAIVWIDAGLHATETVTAQTHIQLVYDLLSGTDPETLRFLDDDIVLLPIVNPDGMQLVADWYMREPDPKKRRNADLPVLYQKYIGHDDNRDFYASTQAETTNDNRALWRDWRPQMVYNEHQTGPLGTVVFIPPFRDPFNFHYDPLVITSTDSLAYAMHDRLIRNGMPGSTMRSGAPYSTWFNGGLRTVSYFHNTLGILTEIIGDPTPYELPLVPRKQLAGEDLPDPVAPQLWHFRKSVDYMLQMDRAVMDYASKNREQLLLDYWTMGRNAVQRGSQDSWTITPKRIAALEAAAKAGKPPEGVQGIPGLVGYDAREAVDAKLYDSVLHAPDQRDARGYILPADQPDLPTAVRFLNSLLNNGVEVKRATSAFTVAGKSYPAGSYVVRTDQAFRPHVLDMFEPQDHPQDFAYPGGPPNRPYDITGYALALQMGVKFDRVLDAFDGPFAPVPDVIAAPPPGRIVGAGGAGWLLEPRAEQRLRAHQPADEGGAEGVLDVRDEPRGRPRVRARRPVGARHGREPRTGGARRVRPRADRLRRRRRSRRREDRAEARADRTGGRVWRLHAGGLDPLDLRAVRVPLHPGLSPKAERGRPEARLRLAGVRRRDRPVGRRARRGWRLRPPPARRGEHPRAVPRPPGPDHRRRHHPQDRRVRQVGRHGHRRRRLQPDRDRAGPAGGERAGRAGT